MKSTNNTSFESYHQQESNIVKLQTAVLQVGIIASASLAILTTAAAGQITLSVTNIRNTDGVIRCGLFASAAGFREPGREASEVTGKISGGMATCTFKSVPEGTYAVAVFHAEKNERKMDIGMFGKPKQGVGFSRNPSIAFGAPSFEATSFAVGSAPVSLSINLSY